MTSRRRRRVAGRRDDGPPAPGAAEAASATCWLCARPLGARIEWHHAVPKSRGGRIVVPVHPICHRTLHAALSNAELARLEREGTPLAQTPQIERFLRWIADKPPDFHAPTRSAR